MLFQFRKTILTFFSVFLFLFASASTDSSRLRISLITCTPGDELYSIFGHSAIRVIDSNSVTDHIYNYGTFDFEDKDFYLKFVKGKLLYFVSVEQTDDFIQYYQYTNRGITEQVLNLTDAQKSFIRHALVENMKEENRYYKYDFFYDNCTTRLRNLIQSATDQQSSAPLVMPKGTTFRQAIHQYLEQGHQYWSELGIDLLLGLPTDKVMTSEEQEFLPDNLMMALHKHHSKPLVATTQTIYKQVSKPNETTELQPIWIIAAFSLIYFLVSLINNNTTRLIISVLDRVLLITTGILGLILFCAWTMTDHTMTVSNLNLLWAWPLNVMVAFFPKLNRDWLKKYFMLQCFILSMTIVCWFFLPQQLNNALLPFVMLLCYRNYAISKK